MSIQIDRLEIKPITKPITVKMENKTAMIIHDHKSDNVICYINLDDNKEDNKELADQLKITIENFIEAKENESED